MAILKLQGKRCEDTLLVEWSGPRASKAYVFHCSGALPEGLPVGVVEKYDEVCPNCVPASQMFSFPLGGRPRASKPYVEVGLVLLTIFPNGLALMQWYDLSAKTHGPKNTWTKTCRDLHTDT